MDKGVKFVLDNIQKTLNLIETNPEYEPYKKKVQTEYNRIKYIKYTGNMYEYFLKFKGDNHKYADDFKFLDENGVISNELMADYLKNHFSSELNNYSGIEDLIIGNVYSNSEITNTFKCAYMGGMRRSLETNSLVLIAKHNNPLYDDQWTDDEILNYTGMGTNGDQDINYSQNKTLKNSKIEGIKVYLFESYKDNEYYFDGEVELAGAPFESEEVDINGDMRKVIKFPLRRINNSNPIVVDIEDILKSEQEKVKEVRRHTLQQIKEKASKATNHNIPTKEVKTVYRERNQYIAEYTKERAKGICDLCGNEAPFKDKSGKPYLESHHVITLADNGPDAIYNTVAICPNCHRKVHVLKRKEDTEKLSRIILKYLLAEQDLENVNNWDELFKNK